ncbi:hypothetical protein DSCW_24040 [Desulfosarcina widdelii]|uniref:Class III cytochrome C domain-containing protein n=1 Tax=Desulfosarcina widdelii TaxID=947919 RepID=A0A5K7ZFU8_9BACT|nr:cytochrome c3 family protein [Desulfosarcina widdelii]BBO74987.1 hypothetical protein DSCW_24040 [Desulfosarcina widdelii]
MTSKKQRLFAYGLAIHLLLVGIICYAAFPTQTPDEPIRIMYQTNAGKVLFEHHTHTDAFGYGAACFDCHHHPSDDEAALIACGQCHQGPAEDGGQPEVCLDCHDESDIEDTEMSSRADAFHTQCTECHEQFGKGPPSGSENCSACHVL